MNDPWRSMHMCDPWTSMPTGGDRGCEYRDVWEPDAAWNSDEH